ncbi:MAG: hypothetical protein IJB72_07145 [Clostridia bacterium]|nr:hypothetical protein [Clostridia bacterium]
MGWAKYTEDDYDAFYERLEMKGWDTETTYHSYNANSKDDFKFKEQKEK